MPLPQSSAKKRLRSRLGTLPGAALSRRGIWVGFHHQLSVWRTGAGAPQRCVRTGTALKVCTRSARGAHLHPCLTHRLLRGAQRISRAVTPAGRRRHHQERAREGTGSAHTLRERTGARGGRQGALVW
jgi:hypothetical protein